VKLNSIEVSLYFFFEYRSVLKLSCHYRSSLLVLHCSLISKLLQKRTSTPATCASMRLRSIVSAPSTPALRCLAAGPSGTASAPSHSPVSALTPIPESEDNDPQSPTAALINTHIVTPTALPLCLRTESDSSSDFEYPISSTNRASLAMSFIPNQLAVVEHVHQSKSPVLLAGEIDPAVMHMFELGCLDFFDSKEIKEEDQVWKILGCFRDTRIHDWISGDRSRLLTLSFPDFMTKLCANYLDPDWEPTVCCQILAATLKHNQSFWDWFSHMQSLNSLLANTASHFSDSSLHEKLEAGLDPELMRCCNANKVDKILVLRLWALKIKRHDENRHTDLKWAHEVTKEVFNQRDDTNKCRRGTNGPANPATYTANAAAATTVAIAGTIRCLAALTDAKCDKLDNNNSCRKCRRLNVYHISKNCLNGFPDTAMYTGLINDPLHPPPPSAPGSLNAAVNIPATANAGLSSDSTAPKNKSQSRPIVAIGLWADETAATFPSASSALREGSNTEDDENEEVSAPFCAPHLWWKGTVTGPNVSLPVTVPMLLDNGAHVVLIHTDLVMELGLRRCLLPEPETVDVAVKSSDAFSRTTLTEWVKLSVTSLDDQWTSRTVHALIAPHLCTSIILGLPFLSHNSIVTNHTTCTCIDKHTNYDLLNPAPLPLLKRMKPRLKEQLKQVRADHKLLLAELKYVLSARRHLMSFDYIKPFDVVGAINKHVETLSHVAELMVP
jgi:hypothetical protein